MKKRIWSLALAAVMALSLGITATASKVEPAEEETLKITKIYEITNEEVSTSPAEKFTFTVEAYSFNGSIEEEDIKDMPKVTVEEVEFAALTETSKDTDNLTISLPEFSTVGEYVYRIKEVDGGTLGVDYYGGDLYLVIQVMNEEKDGEYTGKLVVASKKIHDGSSSGTENKIYEIKNIYSAGSLTVGKSVIGNFGERSREFEITVTFTYDGEDTIRSTITYGDESIDPAAWSDMSAYMEASVTLTLTDGDKIKFENIPYGVSYEVEETDGSIADDGYEHPTYEGETKGKIESENVSVTVTNEKTGEIDTGVALDSLPYILMLAAVAAVSALLLYRRHRKNNM